MARKPRVHYPGAFYHVILRGNDRQPIFFRDSDRSFWESILVTALIRYEARIHCYCWMTNHVHMIVQVGEEPLASTIRYAASQYARKINLQQQRTGHLFERRHRAFVIRDDEYFKGLVRYIHCNPIRAGMVDDINQYRWSSHPVFAGQATSSWLETQTVLRVFGAKQRTARQRYLMFMSTDDDGEDLSRYREGPDEEDEVVEEQTTCLCKPASPIPKLNSQILESIIHHHLQRSGLTEALLTGPGRTRHVAKIRTDIALEALEQGVAKIADLSRRLNRSESAISQAVSARKKI